MRPSSSTAWQREQRLTTVSSSTANPADASCAAEGVGAASARAATRVGTSAEANPGRRRASGVSMSGRAVEAISASGSG